MQVSIAAKAILHIHTDITNDKMKLILLSWMFSCVIEGENCYSLKTVKVSKRDMNLEIGLQISCRHLTALHQTTISSLLLGTSWSLTWFKTGKSFIEYNYVREISTYSVPKSI